MKAIGTIEIEQGLVLNNPTLIIKSVQYEQFDNLVNVECYFNEEGANFTHSRTFTFNNEEGKQLVKSDIITLVSNHEVLNVFK